MARITKRLLTVALLISALFSGQVGVSAQEATTLDTGRSVSARSVERRFAIYYWLDRVDIDEHYLDNEWQIAQIRKYLLISPKIDSITFLPMHLLRVCMSATYGSPAREQRLHAVSS